MKPTVLLPFALAGNASWLAHYLQFENVLIEAKEHFVKQSYRNRFTILGANGPLNLIIPILHGRKERVPMDDVRIAYHHDWQREQWQSLVSAYRSSPYFEYFEQDVSPVWFEKHERLIDRNQAILELTLRLMHEELRHEVTTEYSADHGEGTLDLRQTIHPKKPWPAAMAYPEYPQVFEDRHPFQADLSAFDLLFNLGPQAADHLKDLPLHA